MAGAPALIFPRQRCVIVSSIPFPRFSNCLSISPQWGVLFLSNVGRQVIKLCSGAQRAACTVRSVSDRPQTIAYIAYISVWKNAFREAARENQVGNVDFIDSVPARYGGHVDGSYIKPAEGIYENRQNVYNNGDTHKPEVFP